MNCVTSRGYLRYPHVHGELLVFVAEDDLWLAPAEGGRAWRLSSDAAQASHPRFSRDGTRIAWTSWRDGSPEVYLTDPDGSAATRLTYWGDNITCTVGWTTAGEVLAVTAAGESDAQYGWAYAIPVEGAPPRRLPFGPVNDLALEPAATALQTGRMGREPAYWKRYRGGTAGKLWTATADDPLFTRILADFDTQLTCPMLLGDRLFFLSDHEGTGNVYSCALDGTDIARHTDHDGMYARNASTDGQRIVYHVAGDLWILDGPDAAGPRRLDISLGSPAAARAPRLITARDHLGSLDCDQTGQASVVEVRGTVHWLTHQDGPARALHVDPEARGPDARGPRRGRPGGVDHRRGRPRCARDRVGQRRATARSACRRSAGHGAGAGCFPGRGYGRRRRARRPAAGRGRGPQFLGPGPRAGRGRQRACRRAVLVAGLGLAGLVPARAVAAAPDPHRPAGRRRGHRRDRRPVRRYRPGLHRRRPAPGLPVGAQLRPGV